MFRIVVLFCAALALVNGQTTEVSRCTFYNGELPINAYIEGCITPPCALPQLQDTIINIVFRAPYTLNEMRTVAGAFLPGIAGLLPIPYDLGENSVTCNFLTNTYCPVVKGEIVQYVLKMYILSSFPVGTQVSVEFRIVDGNNSPIMCIRVPIRIVGPVESRDGARNATIIDFN